MAEIRASGTWGSALTSDEFAAIRSVGFEPAGQVLGACVYNIGYTGGYSCPGAWGTMGYGSVMPYRTKTQVSSRSGWGSFAPLVPAMYWARHDARVQLERDVGRLGGEGVVIADMEMHVRERECPVSEGRRDHIVEVTTIGTAIARFARSEQRHSGPTLAIMSLDPQRRQAARIRI